MVGAYDEFSRHHDYNLLAARVALNGRFPPGLPPTLLRMLLCGGSVPKRPKPLSGAQARRKAAVRKNTEPIVDLVLVFASTGYWPVPVPELGTHISQDVALAAVHKDVVACLARFRQCSLGHCRRRSTTRRDGSNAAHDPRHGTSGTAGRRRSLT
jgi:hypothetical protein